MSDVYSELRQSEAVQSDTSCVAASQWQESVSESCDWTGHGGGGWTQSSLSLDRVLVSDAHVRGSGNERELMSVYSH